MSTVASVPVVEVRTGQAARKPGDLLQLKLGTVKRGGLFGFGGSIVPVEMAFSYCPPGTFAMGSPASESGRDPDERSHQVTLTRGFWMGLFPVTQAQYRCVTSRNPSYFRGESLPVEGVDWATAKDFCKRLSDRVGKPVRLPTEAEWEYACRAGRSTAFWSGNDEADMEALTWYGATSVGETRPVGADSVPNPWGVYDTQGNVWEWCEDWYDPHYYYRSPRENPVCEEGEQTHRILRGGCWASYWRHCRAAYRGRNMPAFSNNQIGFRVVFSDG